MTGEFISHATYISGTRMQAYGVDAMSIGNTSEEVMAGNKLIAYLPLYLLALERSKGFLS